MMAASSVFFGGMAVMVRGLSSSLSAGQLVLFRFAVGLFAMAAYFAARRRGPEIPRVGPWLMRGAFGGVAVYLYFVAVGELGAGPATVLNNSSPVYAALFATFFLRERPNAHLWLGLGLATFGSMLVIASTVTPGSFTLSGGALAGLLAGVFGGASAAVIRSLRRDTEATSVFLSFCIFGVLVGGPMAAVHWRPVGGEALLLAVAVGLVSLAAQLLYTYAFAFVNVAVGKAITQLTVPLWEG